MRSILSALLVGSAVVVGVIGLFWWGQRWLMYLPVGGAVPRPGAVGLPNASDVVVTTEDGLSLHCWFVEPAGDARGWMLILFNGNAGHRGYRAPLARRLIERGVAVLMVDYRGYGGNPGAPTEQGLLRDARAARRWVDRRQRGGAAKVAYLGESLGSGVAVALAAERPPDALILRSPFTSMVDVGRHHYPLLPVRWLLRDRYASDALIGRLSCPVLVVAAERDSVVPAVLARRLFEAAAPARRHWLQLAGADHNDYEALAGDTVVDAIVRLLEES